MTDLPHLTEVLPEPGSHQLWVTFSDQQTFLIDLKPLLTLPTFQVLKLSRLFCRARADLTGLNIIWPGGTLISTRDLLLAPGKEGTLPLKVLARVPEEQRYRPLLPYIQHLDLPIYLRPWPIEAGVVERLLQLRTGELKTLLTRSAVPEPQVFARLYDVAVFLSEHFGSATLPTLLRRPWRYSQQLCPGQPLLDTMLGCLLHGRPDLVEQPCRWLSTGGRSSDQEA